MSFIIYPREVGIAKAELFSQNKEHYSDNFLYKVVNDRYMSFDVMARLYDAGVEVGYCHLIRGGENILWGKKAVHCVVYGDGTVIYKTADGYFHIMMRDEGDKDLLQGKRAIYVNYDSPRFWSYQTEDFDWIRHHPENTRAIYYEMLEKL